jgi:uncharacterized membrane protein YeaQ/YmgE (transglycosylase-associated protein family)
MCQLPTRWLSIRLSITLALQLPSQLYEGHNMFWLLWVILVGLIAGWAAGKIMKGSGYGPLMDIALGIVGAIVGGFLVRLVGFAPMGGLISSIITATLGAVVLIWIARKLK